MEESKESTAKQSQGGDDSGYSCTSTKSKYSQSESSGDICFEERKLSTLKTNIDGMMSTLNSVSSELPNETNLQNISGEDTTANQESCAKSSKSVKLNLDTFGPQIDQLFNVNESKQHPSTSKMDLDESNILSGDTEENKKRNNTIFLQLATLCQSNRDYFNTIKTSSNAIDESTLLDTATIKELNEQEMQLKEIIESNEVSDDLFGVVVSMTDGLIINTSKSIHKNMGYQKDMLQGRSFIDFVHPKDRISFISYVTTVLMDPSIISRRDNLSTVTFLRAKNNDGFYCNMRRYRCLNTGYSISKKKNHHQVCKLTITFKDVSYASKFPCSVKTTETPPSQLLLIIKAHLIHSAYTYPEERKENPLNFITKHNALLEWCYVDHLSISHFGYLPQNIIGRSIFSHYNTEDLTTIKEIHENVIKARSVPFRGKPYRFKCQNGDFALVQTEWSNFINPWSGRVEFVIGRHKVIQGPANPDVTTPTDDVAFKLQVIEDQQIHNKMYEDIKSLLNKNINENADGSRQINQTMDANTKNVKQQISKKCEDLALFMNCLVDGVDPSAQIPLEVEVLPETCGSFSDHDSVLLGEISPHHNHESKSSSGTPPSYTQLNYNDNIQRFFESNLKTNSSEIMSDGSYPKETTKEEVTPPCTETDKVNHETFKLIQNVTPNSSIIVCNHMSITGDSDQNSHKNSQQPLTQKMLLRHNKKMEDDLVKQHKHNTKKIKSSEKQKQNMSDEISIETPNLPRGIKRSNSSIHENKSNKLTKRKHNGCSNPTYEISPIQVVESATVPHTVAKATQIWPPYQVTRDSQTTIDFQKPVTLGSQVLYYNIPLSNNVMPVQLSNKYENLYPLVNPYGKNQELPPTQLQPFTVPLYSTTPVMNHIPQNPQILQQYIQYHNKLLLPTQPYQDIQSKNKMDTQNDVPTDNILSKTFHQNTITLKVNQEEVITSSDSDCKKDIGSLRSSSDWMYEDSSFYSSSFRDKTDMSSEKEESSWPSEFNMTNVQQQFVKKLPFWMEDVVTTPDLIYRYQMKPSSDINEILMKDMIALNSLTQPLLVNEQLKQLCVELDVSGTSNSYFEDGSSSSSGGDERLISIGQSKKRKTDFCRMAMIYEENAPLPPPTSTSPFETCSSNMCDK